MKRLLVKYIIFFLSFSMEIRIAHAEELSVIDVRRNIPLSDHEPTYRDYYIAGDGIQSLKKNLVIEVVRKNNIRDASGAQSYGEILIPVGQLRIIANYGRVAIAREYKYFSREDYPTLDQTFIMTGDRINIKNSFTDGNKIKRTAENLIPDANTLVSAISAFGIPLSPAVVAALSQLQSNAHATESEQVPQLENSTMPQGENTESPPMNTSQLDSLQVAPKTPELTIPQNQEQTPDPSLETNKEMAKSETTEEKSL